jgi:transcriptional regulator with XRE-family HTH domain
MVPDKPKYMGQEEARLVRTIASNMKRLRKLRNLKQYDMVDYGFNYRHYQRIESGKYTPSIETLIRLAKVFKVKVIDLLK